MRIAALQHDIVWEDATATTWVDTVAHFATEFNKVGRTEAREVEFTKGDYSSAAALTQARLSISITTTDTMTATDVLALL